MRAVVQRVVYSRVESESVETGRIGKGLTVLLGISRSDTEKDADYIVKKLLGLRVFDDEHGVMNKNIFESCAEGETPEMLVVSQFTLYGDARHGNRPSYIEAQAPELAKPLYEYAVKKLTDAGVTVRTGVFRTEMLVEIHNDGPITILLDSNKTF